MELPGYRRGFITLGARAGVPDCGGFRGFCCLCLAPARGADTAGIDLRLRQPAGRSFARLLSCERADDRAHVVCRESDHRLGRDGQRAQTIAICNPTNRNAATDCKSPRLLNIRFL